MLSNLVALVGTVLLLVIGVIAVPAPQYSSGSCSSVTTIYVTLPLTAGDSASMEPTTTLGAPALNVPVVVTPSSRAPPAADLAPGLYTTYTAHLTSTIEQTVVVTNTMTRTAQMISLAAETSSASLKTFPSLGASVITGLSVTTDLDLGTTISIVVTTIGPVSTTEAQVKSSPVSPAASGDSVVVVYQTVSVIPVPVGYVFPSSSEPSSAPKTGHTGTTFDAQAVNVSSGGKANSTPSSAIVSLTASAGPTNAAKVPLTSTYTYVGTGGWNLTTCAKLTSMSHHHPSSFDSAVTVIYNSTFSGFTSSLPGMSSSLAASRELSTSAHAYSSAGVTISPAASAMSRFSVGANSTATQSSTFMYPIFTGTTSGPIVDDSGLTTSSASSTSSSGFNPKNVTSSHSVTSIGVAASSTSTATSISTSGSVVDDNGLRTSSMVAIYPTESLTLATADSSSTFVASNSVTSTFQTYTISSFSRFDTFGPSVSPSVRGKNTASSISASASPTSCRDPGYFTLDFDDLPPLAAASDTANPMPLFSPYHNFYFDPGFVVVPPPTDPYLPASGKLLLEYIPTNGSKNIGEISNDFTEFTGCFNFNARSTSLGCNSTGPTCDWEFTGLRYDFATEIEDEVASQKISTKSCPGLRNCSLVPVYFDESFNNLTSLLIRGTVGGVDKVWWMDSVNLTWYDNSCEKELCRAGSHK